MTAGLRQSITGAEPITDPQPAATRIQANVLARGERRLLSWLCARLPAWATPDGLTAIGFGGMMLVAAGYVLSARNVDWLWLSVVGYCVNWFGDSLDGSLARFRGIERPRFGYFIDHSTDALGNLIAIGALGFSAHMRLDTALYAIAGYLLLMIHTFIAAKVANEFRLSYLGGGPTELRLMLIAMTLTMWAVQPHIVVAGLSAFDLFAVAVGTILISLFIVQTLSTARMLAREGR